MEWIFFLVGAVVVVLIAFVAVGKAVGQLEVERSPAVYDLNDAVLLDRATASRRGDRADLL